jgi:hypothetical protein
MTQILDEHKLFRQHLENVRNDEVIQACARVIKAHHLEKDFAVQLWAVKAEKEDLSEAFFPEIKHRRE